MSQTLLFVQIQGDARIIELAVAERVSEAEFHNALAATGVPLAPELFVFIDEADEHVPCEGNRLVEGLGHGARVHVARCRRIKTTIHFLDKTVEHVFAPGTRVHTVKKWAAHEVQLDHKDAAEHVLQICNSAKRPPSDTPLHALVHSEDCAVCFDLVPEKRVEG